MIDTFHIHIEGIVQGVGYRPFIANLAKQKNLLGNVANGSDGLHIIFNASQNDANDLLQYLTYNHPEKAKIFHISFAKIEHVIYTNFEILDSLVHQSLGFISPDFSICDQCKTELLDHSNRRYHYPFITCTSCGPRFSILHRMPYDRVSTTMVNFIMCEVCNTEYKNHQDRRYFSQTNSCEKCGVKITIKDNTGKSIDYSLQDIAHEILQGKIIAVKGIGGYLLICDATNNISVKKLRERKNRPAKPLAVLFENIFEIDKYCEINQKQKSELESQVGPIVLLKYNKYNDNLPIEIIAPGLNSIGVMFPNNGLLLLLSNYTSRPLIATSANMSGSPIIYNNIDAEINLKDIYDYIISHDRDILMPQDDSVVRFSHFYNKKIILRRGRGQAPTFWKKTKPIIDTIFGCGALMKSSFSFAQDGHIYTSQFLGNLGSYESSQMYLHTLRHFKNIINKNVSLLIRDLHPSFLIEEEIKSILPNAKTVPLQHHKAHFYSLLFEYDLLNTDTNILGVVWDGIGYGEDGNIWGGEFFEYGNGQMNRISHFHYFPYLLGDKMSLQPRLAAIALCADQPEYLGLLKDKFSDKEFDLYYKMLQKSPPISTSSIGRIFDALSSILGLADINEYESQAAMLLEQLAEKYFIENGLNQIQECYNFELKDNVIMTQLFIKEIFADLNNNLSKDFMAAKFHTSLILLIKKIAKPNQAIAFSGGVWQNALLVDLAISYLSSDHPLYFHEQLSPNDENISVGQIGYALGDNLLLGNIY